MALKAPVKETYERELTPEGSYQGVCYAVYDIGTRVSDYKGKERDQHEIVIIFELPSLRIEYDKDGEKLEGPRVISLRNTFSMSEKANLRKHMETWRGKSFTDLEAADFDFEKLVGANAIIQVMHKTKNNGDVSAIIGSITTPLKEMEPKKPENPKSFFSFYAPHVDDQGVHFPENMPEWVQNEIKESFEYKAIIHAREDLEKPTTGGLTEPPEPGGVVDQKMTDVDELGEPDDELPF